MEFDIKNIKCVLCKIEWYEERMNSCEPYTMSKRFYNDIILTLERKIGAAKRLTALKSCAGHLTIMRDLHDAQAKFNMSRYQSVKDRITTLELELKRAQYEFYSKGLQQILTREVKDRLQQTILSTRRSIGQYKRTLERMDGLRKIQPQPIAPASDGLSTKNKFKADKKRLSGAKSGSYIPTAEEIAKANNIMPDLGADFFKTGTKEK